MQFISWNCKGLGNPIKAQAVKDLLKMARVEILLLQETKIEEEALLLVSKNKWKLNGGKAVNARGTYGGLTTLCSDENFQLKNWFATQHWIFSELFHIASKTSVALFNLYVPVNHNEKRECWSSLTDFLVSNSPVNIILAGDLNICLAPNKKKRRTAWKGFYD